MPLNDYLQLFDQEDDEYKKLIHDGTRPEIDPIQNINDIDNGALHNAIEWHKRHAQRYGVEVAIPDARNTILDIWAEFWNITRPSGMTDAGFAQYIINTVIAVATTQPVIASIFSTETIQEPAQIGPYLDQSFLDTRHRGDTGVAGFTLVPNCCTLYVIFPSSALYDAGRARSAGAVKAAGIAIFFGVNEV